MAKPGLRNGIYGIVIDGQHPYVAPCCRMGE